MSRPKVLSLDTPVKSAIDVTFEEYTSHLDVIKKAVDAMSVDAFGDYFSLAAVQIAYGALGEKFITGASWTKGFAAATVTAAGHVLHSRLDALDNAKVPDEEAATQEKTADPWVIYKADLEAARDDASWKRFAGVVSVLYRMIFTVAYIRSIDAGTVCELQRALVLATAPELQELDLFRDRFHVTELELLPAPADMTEALEKTLGAANAELATKKGLCLQAASKILCDLVNLSPFRVDNLRMALVLARVYTGVENLAFPQAIDLSSAEAREKFDNAVQSHTLGKPDQMRALLAETAMQRTHVILRFASF